MNKPLTTEIAEGVVELANDGKTLRSIARIAYEEWGITTATNSVTNPEFEPIHGATILLKSEAFLNNKKNL
jgi:hypothetical protein